MIFEKVALLGFPEQDELGNISDDPFLGLRRYRGKPLLQSDLA